MKPLFAALALALTLAAPAAAQTGHSLTLSGPSTAGTGKATTFQAAGTVPEDVFLQRYVNVYAIPTSVLASCPATYQGAIQVRENSSGQGIETVANHVPASTGSFSVPIVWTPSVAGRFSLCGYLHEGHETMATATHAVTIGGKPANLRKPKVKRSGRKLVCSRGTWANKPTRYSYGWFVNGKRKKGATGSRIALARGSVKCRVKASNAAGSASATSLALRVR